MEAHPAAALFPLLEGDDFAALCNDIRTNGQIEPIVILDGKILDGRNRHAACEKLGVSPTFAKWSADDVGDPIAYVMSVNMHRRHLSEGQRGMIGLEVEKMYAAEAKKRQGKRNDLPEHCGASATMSNGKARDQAAAVVGVGARTISSCKRVAEDGAKQAADAVRAGKVSPKVAEKLVRSVPDKAEQAAIIKRAIASDKPDRVVNEAVAPKNPPPQYILSDQVLDITEQFVAMAQAIYTEHGGPKGLFANKHWDSKQTGYFRQHLAGLPGLLAKLRKDSEGNV